MNNIQIYSIYDQLCALITDYEQEEDFRKSADCAEMMYLEIRNIVNQFAEYLN